MEYTALSSAFSKIQDELQLPEYLKEICTLIKESTINREKIDVILASYNINYTTAKVDFLHLIFEYIKTSLEDDVLTDQEKENIHFLKLCFRIKPGEFYFHNKPDVENVLTSQLSRIYRDDFISEKEALLKVDLQEIFDLSFDQMNDYSKIEASVSVKKGANPKVLDVFFTNKEYFKLKTNPPTA
jgi:hypothetical protein